MSLTVTEASGTWRQIGQAYGEALRPAIAKALRSYERLEHELRVTAPELLTRVAPYGEAARMHSSDRFAELAGMAEGADIGIEQALLLNCVEELTDIEACTTAVKGRFLMHAEMWYADQDDISVLVASPPRGPTVVVAGCAGFLTGVGASSAGFAQGVQSTFSTDSRLGVPRVMHSRDALCASDSVQAVIAACGPHRAGGYGYVIADRRGHRVVETSARRCRVLPGTSAAVHTNHYVSDLAGIGRDAGGDSRERFEFARGVLSAAELRSLEDCAGVLSDDGFRPCRAGDTATTFGLACDLETGSLCISDGDPRDGRWTQLAVPRFTPV